MGVGSDQEQRAFASAKPTNVDETQQYGIPLAYVENYAGVERNRTCMDAAFVIIFFIFCGGLVGIGIYSQISMRNNVNSIDWDSDAMASTKIQTQSIQSTCINSQMSGDDPFELKCQLALFERDLGIVGGCIIASALIAFFWMWLLRLFPKPMIYASMGLTAAFFAAGAIVFFTVFHDWYPAIIWSVVALIYFLYIFLLRRRIAFTAILLTEASHAIGSNLLLVFVVAPLVVILSGGYLAFFVWVSEVILQLWIDTDASGTKWMILWFVQVFGLYWVSNVIMGIYTTTISGTVANWYFTHTTTGQSIGALVSLGWSLTKNLGSICLGSLILAIIEFCRFLLRMAERNNNGAVAIVACCLRCICWLIQSLINYITRYAYIYVAMYSYSFISSAREVFNLFSRSGWQALVNDVILGPVTLIGTLVGTLVGGGACFGITFLAFPHDGFHDGRIIHWFSVLCTVVVCWVIWIQLARILITSVDTIFVCYMEDLERNMQQQACLASTGLVAAVSAHPKTPAKYKNVML